MSKINGTKEGSNSEREILLYSQKEYFLSPATLNANDEK
jgi:hypothetical protein